MIDFDAEVQQILDAAETVKKKAMEDCAEVVEGHLRNILNLLRKASENDDNRMVYRFEGLDEAAEKYRTGFSPMLKRLKTELNKSSLHHELEFIRKFWFFGKRRYYLNIWHY